MTESGDSSEALSGVVMGKTAGATLTGQAAAKAGPSTAMKIDGGTLVARVLQSQGVKYLFAVNGGHTWPILAALREHGIKLIHMRHEQSCAYAADGWARSTATPGVCSNVRPTCSTIACVRPRDAPFGAWTLTKK